MCLWLYFWRLGATSLAPSTIRFGGGGNAYRLPPPFPGGGRSRALSVFHSTVNLLSMAFLDGRDGRVTAKSANFRRGQCTTWRTRPAPQATTVTSTSASTPRTGTGAGDAKLGGSWPNSSPLLLCSHRNAWAGLHLLSRPDTLLAAACTPWPTARARTLSSASPTTWCVAGRWARATIGQFRHPALQTCQGHRAPSYIFPRPTVEEVR
jgi:hypothetical protein